MTDHMRPALFLPETLKVSDTLRQMRQQRQQLALVVDEHGASDGIVTMEDLIEEVVGEIYDDTDRDVQAVVREPDGARLAGGFPVHDLPDTVVDLDDDDADATTVAGLVLARLGHIPTAAGESVEVGRYTAHVVEVSGHAITRIRLRAGPLPGREDNHRLGDRQP